MIPGVVIAEFTDELRETAPAVPDIDVSVILERRWRRPRRTMKLPLVALTSAAAGVLIASVVLQERSARTAFPSTEPLVVVQAPAESEVDVLRQFRNLSLARSINDTRPRGQPGDQQHQQGRPPATPQGRRGRPACRPTSREMRTAT